MDSTPPAGSKIFFSAATAFAERIIRKDRKIPITKTHRGYMAILDNGYLIIDKKWYS